MTDSAFAPRVPRVPRIPRAESPDRASAPDASRHDALERRPASRAEHEQARLLNQRASGPQPVQRATAPNRTGLPDGLKAGVEALSGLSLDGVKVHYNSSRPAQLRAHAFAQGQNIHLAPGQERHLPHEAWHIVQQAQGRVRPTLHDGAPINDDPGLEREADLMGAKAVQRVSIAYADGQPRTLLHLGAGAAEPVQRRLDLENDGKTITRIEFTKRPGWTKAVTSAMPSASGYDRGHLVPWMAIRLEIERNLIGLSGKEAAQWLTDRDHAPDSLSWSDIEKAIKAYGRAENNDLDNLEYEDSSSNRSNGAKLPAAAEIWLASYGEDGQVWAPPYTVTDTSGNPLTLRTKKAARDWCISVGISDNATAKQKAEAKARFAESPCVVM